MNRVFYGMAIVIAVTLILIASSVNRKKTAETPIDTGAGSFNPDQLQDATEKQPIP